MQQTTPGSSAGTALGSLSTAEDVPGKSNSRPHDTLTPVMPCCAFTGSMWKHRKKWAVQSPFSGLALVARPVKAKEIASDSAAKAAMDAEWSSLRAMKTWEEDKVREWSDVCEEARRTGTRNHVGMVFGICVEKGSDLPRGDPSRKFKGRCVFRGNAVRDENHYAAVFQDLGSSPASMSAAKIADLLGLLPGCCTMLADAIRAYCQALLVGVPTWVRLPRDQWPASWSKMRDPVVPLRLALYGHPDAGTCWEKHCDAKLGEKRFSPVIGWPGCYSHSSLAVFLTVYVDDFKMSGREADVAKAWKLIKDSFK